MTFEDLDSRSGGATASWRTGMPVAATLLAVAVANRIPGVDLSLDNELDALIASGAVVLVYRLGRLLETRSRLVGYLVFGRGAGLVPDYQDPPQET